jgi:hypothetical protein
VCKGISPFFSVLQQHSLCVTHPKKKKTRARKAEKSSQPSRERNNLKIYNFCSTAHTPVLSITKFSLSTFGFLINHSSLRARACYTHPRDYLTNSERIKMTESQLPAAAAAQKFGTLIPNRIFGEFQASDG